MGGYSAQPMKKTVISSWKLWIQNSISFGRCTSIPTSLWFHVFFLNRKPNKIHLQFRYSRRFLQKSPQKLNLYLFVAQSKDHRLSKEANTRYEIIFVTVFHVCLCEFCECVINVSLLYGSLFLFLLKSIAACACLMHTHVFLFSSYILFVCSANLNITEQTNDWTSRDNYCVKRNCGYTKILFTQCISIGVGWVSFCVVLDFVWFTFAARFPLTCSNFRFYFETHLVITPFHCITISSFLFLFSSLIFRELYLNAWFVLALVLHQHSTSSSINPSFIANNHHYLIVFMIHQICSAFDRTQSTNQTDQSIVP